MAACGKVSQLRRWLSEQVLGNQLWSEVRIRGFEAGKDQGPPPSPLTPSPPWFCRNSTPSVRPGEDASDAPRQKSDTSIQPTFPYQGRVWRLLNCLDLQNTLLYCSILSVLHVLFPPLWCLEICRRSSLSASVAGGVGLSGCHPVLLTFSSRQEKPEERFMLSGTVGKMGVWALLTGNEVYRRSFCGETESSGQEEGFQKYAGFG